MEIIERGKKYQPLYEQERLPLRKLRVVGDCYVVTIPKHVVKQLNLRKGSYIGVDIFVRRKLFKDEVPIDMETIVVSRKERIQFEKYLKEQRELHSSFNSE